MRILRSPVSFLGLLVGCTAGESAPVPKPAPAVQLSPWLAWAADTAGHLDMAGHLDTTANAMRVPRIVSPSGAWPADSVAPGSGERATSQPARRRVRVRLSPLADSISRSLVLAPKTQTWFTAAARSKRLVVDIGRSDVAIGADAERMAAFQEAVRSRTPLAPGARVRVRGPWGADDATIASIGLLNGRIIATLTGSARVDSVARRAEPLIATVAPAADSLPPIRTACDRSPADSALNERAAAVRDSVAREIMAADWPPYERLEQSLQIAGSRLVGCFGVGRLLLIVSVRAGGFEWVRERVVVVSDSGAVRPLHTLVYRHRAHDAVAAFDADGDGIDDVAVRAMAGGAGALTILRLEDGKRLVPMSSGFAWGN